VIPIADHDRTDIDIIVVVLWTVDNHWTDYTTAVLRTVMRMPPRRSVETCSPCVRKALAWGDWAFRDARNSVIGLRALLKDTVPVDRSAFIAEVVVDSDLNSVTPVGFEERTRELSVDQESSDLDTVWRNLALGDVPLVTPCLASVWYLRFIVVVCLVVRISPWPVTSEVFRKIERSEAKRRKSSAGESAINV